MLNKQIAANSGEFRQPTYTLYRNRGWPMLCLLLLLLLWKSVEDDDDDPISPRYVKLSWV